MVPEVVGKYGEGKNMNLKEIEIVKKEEERSEGWIWRKIKRVNIF